MVKSSEIVIEDGVLRAPKSPVRSSMSAVNLNELSSMEITGAARQRYLKLDHSDGRLLILENALPRGMKVEDLAAEIQSAGASSMGATS